MEALFVGLRWDNGKLLAKDMHLELWPIRHIFEKRTNVVYAILKEANDGRITIERVVIVRKKKDIQNYWRKEAQRTVDQLERLPPPEAKVFAWEHGFRLKFADRKDPMYSPIWPLGYLFALF